MQLSTHQINQKERSADYRQFISTISLAILLLSTRASASANASFSAGMAASSITLTGYYPYCRHATPIGNRLAARRLYCSIAIQRRWQLIMTLMAM